MEGETPDDVLRMMIDESYRLVLAGLSKKAQREITG
jgi:predicted DNA-binding protein (MmcQ/YjbR family)